MTKIFLDTNIWARYLLEDVPTQHQECDRLIQAIEHGLISVCTSTIVIIETLYVLTKTYEVPHHIALQKITGLLHIKSLTLIEKTNLKSALKLHKKTKVKLTDCLIATQLPPNTTLITYDQDFQKLPNLKPMTPNQYLHSLKIT